ncbi:MAG: lamin tail domain-containing protein, partial [bacterium]
FLADNETTQQDQDGEYDDWIELHNPTASEVSLNGLHLSDKTDNVGKWTFPDTSIAAGGYLIVWADEDEEQVGLHANFKLSASGEDVVLAEADLTVIDAINFGAQEVDVSMGRCPDGSGSFATMTPTFAAANSCTPLICGDANGDLVANITDAIYLIQYIFNDGPAPNPLEAGDANCDESANITDAVYLIQYIFADGPVPCEACP